MPTGRVPSILKRALHCVWALCLFAAVCSASEPEHLPLSAPARIISEMIHGSLTGRYYGYTRTSEKEPNRHWAEVDLKLELSKHFTDTLSGTVRPRLRFDTAGFAQGVVDSLSEDSEHRYILNLDEAWMRYTHDRWQITAGKNIFGWGTADAYNPTDSLNPRDFTDVPDSEKIGVIALAFTYSWDLATLDAVTVPLFTPARLPDIDNRWVGDLSALRQAFFPLRPVIGDDELPDATIENVQFAVRLSSSAFLEGWDLGLSYYDGFDPFGVFRVDPATPDIILTRVFQHIREVGFDFSTAFGSVEAHGEAAVRFTGDNAMGDDYWEYIAGVNYGFDDLTLPPLVEEFRIILEYAGEYVFEEKEESGQYFVSSGYDRPFKNSILGSLLVKFSEETEFEIGGGVNLDDSDYFIEPVLRHKITDTLKLEVGGNVIKGPRGSFLGRWRDNDRVSVSLKKYF